MRTLRTRDIAGAFSIALITEKSENAVQRHTKSIEKFTKS